MQNTGFGIRQKKYDQILTLWMMSRGKIAAVSYLNTVPFIYGIEHADSLQASLLLSPPSRCAEAFESGKATTALVPVGALPALPDYNIITDYCIGARKNVRTVTLMSDCPLADIQTIYLDSHSITSAVLVKILAAELWNIAPQWKELSDYSLIDRRGPHEAFLLIGDKVFDYESWFSNVTDLAGNWISHTGLPFVFAVWITVPQTPQSRIDLLNDALGYGIRHIPQAVQYYGHSGKEYAYGYLTENIDFAFDQQKKRALAVYLEKGEPYFRRRNPG